jgi:hypothetical protein
MTPERARLLEQCTEEVETRSGPLLARCVDAVNVSLQAAELASEDTRLRHLYSLAAWSLAQSRGSLIKSYPGRLRQAIVVQQDERNLSNLAELSDSSMLQLVDDEAVSESLESARLLQNLLPLVEHALPVLDARMSSLAGFDSVQIEKNPLRPSVFVRELRDLMAEVETDPEIRTLWLQHIAHVLGRELGQLYEQIALMLQRANVQEASYRIRLVDDPEASRASGYGALADAESTGAGPVSRYGAANTAPGAGGAGRWAMEDTPSLARAASDLPNSLFHAFLSEPSATFSQALDDDYYDQVREEMRQVDAEAAQAPAGDAPPEPGESGYRALPPVDRPQRQVTSETHLRSDRWGDYAPAHERTRVLLELKQRAEDVSQVVGLDLVRKLVNQVARDPLLLAPVREAVVALEPALLRLALANPRYFGLANHPARRLVEQVAQRSFRFNDEFGSDFLAFLDPVRLAFNQLNALKSESEQPFGQVLDRLLDAWKNEDEAEAAAHQQQLKALKFAQDRQELADQVAWEISLRPDVFNAPGLVLDFLYATWSLVIASAQLRDPTGAKDPGGYRASVGTLLWSVRPEILRQPKQVFEALPGLLKELHSGLASLGQTPEESQSFFDALMHLHQPLLKLRRVRARSDASSSAPAPLEEDLQAAAAPDRRSGTQSAPRPKVTDQPWLAAAEMSSAGFEDTLPLVSAAVEAEQASPSASEPQNDDNRAAPEMGQEQVETLLLQLRTGCLVDLYSGGVWLRAELIWASNRSTLFMFTSRGGRTHSMTRRSCEKLVRCRWLRVVEVRPVVEAALDQVAARGSSGRSKRSRDNTVAA